MTELYPVQKAALLYMMDFNNWRKQYGQTIPPSGSALARHLGHKHTPYAYRLIQHLVESGYLESDTLKPTVKAKEIHG